MKKSLLIIGIVAIVIGVFSILTGIFFGYVSMNTLDAPLSVYHTQRRIMVILIIAVITFIASGVLCIKIHTKTS